MQNADDRVLYGTTHAGGTNNAGTLFKIRTNGTDYSVLRNFGSGVSDSTEPGGTLVDGADTYLYGTAEGGGVYGYGTWMGIYHPEPL